ncbi:MAG: hypothetical protein RIS70_318, partial [Planctomycetota bacterium]
SLLFAARLSSKAYRRIASLRRTRYDARWVLESPELECPLCP